MGTQIRLVFYSKNKQIADSIADLAFKRIDDLNNKLSDYEKNSELNKLCEKANKDVAVSNDLYRALNESVQISKETEGAFDITAGPLIQLWRNTRKTKILPSKSQLEIAKHKVGYLNIKFPKLNTIRLDKEGIQLDLGGIGKGFAADEVIQLLKNNGVTSALIDMGGDIRVSNPPPNKEYWILAFSYLDDIGKEVQKRIRLRNGAVATSGDLFQYVKINGVRYSHIVNPKTGMALTKSTQVTIISKTATKADAYASAYSVIGLDKASTDLKDLPNFDIFIAENSVNDNRQWSSPNFDNYIDQ